MEPTPILKLTFDTLLWAWDAKCHQAFKSDKEPSGQELCSWEFCRRYF